ncbi:hypothetical protein AX16_008931 [Volvariella volvacea WC 439]|nr:hypothetical protein AX16_008931 [Volvariella volvacea WC 439]
MPDGGANSFLPRIQSVFYAVFDDRLGPKIVHQVPEGLIAVPAINSALSSVPPTPSTESPVAPVPQFPTAPALSSRHSSNSALTSPQDFRSNGRSLASPQKQQSPLTLFNFDNISKYVIPPSPLCGRLVTCSTKNHRIIGFPVELMGKYKRYYFRYNLCFVFERSADLSCYEPIVRKVSRVLTACEEESNFLSNTQNSPALLAILEQLYEDLNSYSETSIPIDQFNSIELKIFPFYPNPLPVKDWQVPLALINLTKRIEDNWDLTMAKVCRYIDGTNHVSRIAQLADCDINLTRQAISHLLYYQVIMMIDIFQYSNMYTLRRSIQWLADETHVKEECGPYVTIPGKPIPDWPRLLHLYSRMKPGKTIFEWMESHEVYKLGIDIRRFTSFGVVKGFLRRVHRWPILLQTEKDISTSQELPAPRKRGQSLTGPAIHFSAFHPSSPPQDTSMRGRPYHPVSSTTGPDQNMTPTIPAPPVTFELGNAAISTAGQGSAAINVSATQRSRRASAAEKVLEQLRTRDLHKSGSPRSSWLHHYREETTPTLTSLPPAMLTNQESPTRPNTTGSGGGRPPSRRQSLISPPNPPPSPILGKSSILTPTRPRLSRSPSVPNMAQPYRADSQTQMTPYPSELLTLLDGEHHTDELSVRFGVGWPTLEEWLVAVGAGKDNGDYGRVSIICR